MDCKSLEIETVAYIFRVLTVPIRVLSLDNFTFKAVDNLDVIYNVPVYL